MARHVAFLRGMNLGKRRITNDELTAAFESLGMKDVKTFLASGNVVFDTTRRANVARHVETGLREILGYEVPTFLRSADDVRGLADTEPFGAAALRGTKGNVQVIFLQTAVATAARRKLDALSTEDDRLVVGAREIFWLPRSGISDSALDLKALEAAGGPTTIRTKRTVDRLTKKFL